jgi:hypothetical protein
VEGKGGAPGQGEHRAARRTAEHARGHGEDESGHPANHLAGALFHPAGARFHLETLVIYKVDSIKFTTRNDLYM